MWEDMLNITKKAGEIMLFSVVAFFAFLLFGDIVFRFEDTPVTDEYGYTNADDNLTMEQLIEYYGGEAAYIYDPNYGVYLYLENDDNLHYLIDDSVTDEYVALFDRAITFYNELGFVNITYERADTTLDLDNLPDNYYAVFEYETFEDDFLDAMAYNEIAWDFTGNIWYSVIYLSTDVYYSYDNDTLIALLVHEIGHTFGLVDLYDADFADDSIFYYRDVEGAPTELTEFDIYNLRYLYEE